jgi:hypothetical protein
MLTTDLAGQMKEGKIHNNVISLSLLLTDSSCITSASLSPHVLDVFFPINIAII